MTLTPANAGRPSQRFPTWRRPSLEHGKLNEFNWLVLRPENLKLADFVDIGAFTLLQAGSGIEIEKDVQIGSHVSIYSESTIDGKKGKVTLKENCRIGTHSTLMPGVTIGQNSVIGAHSFVTESVGDNELWMGVPARLVRKL